DPTPAPSPGSSNPGSQSTGGTSPRAFTASSKRAPGAVISGAVSPAPAGRRALLQTRTHGRWQTIRVLRLRRDGGFSVVMPVAGLYRVRSGGLPGPAVRVV